MTASRSESPGREVVRGDIVIVAEGDRVPADAVLRQAINLTVDESLLTGESVPVRKVAPPAHRPMLARRAAMTCRSCIPGHW